MSINLRGCYACSMATAIHAALNLQLDAAWMPSVSISKGHSETAGLVGCAKRLHKN